MISTIRNGRETQVKAGDLTNEDILVSYSEKTGRREEFLVSKISHVGSQKATTLLFTYNYDGKNESLQITPRHFVFISRDNQRLHVKGSEAKVGDYFIRINP